MRNRKIHHTFYKKLPIPLFLRFTMMMAFPSHKSKGTVFFMEVHGSSITPYYGLESSVFSWLIFSLIGTLFHILREKRQKASQPIGQVLNYLTPNPSKGSSENMRETTDPLPQNCVSTQNSTVFGGDS